MSDEIPRIRFWQIFTLRCRDASRLSSKALDTRLTFTERLALRGHGLMCKSCRRFEVQMRALRMALRRRDELELQMRIGCEPTLSSSSVAPHDDADLHGANDDVQEAVSTPLQEQSAKVASGSMPSSSTRTSGPSPRLRLTPERRQRLQRALRQRIDSALPGPDRTEG